MIVNRFIVEYKKQMPNICSITIWRARQESNLQPLESESSALSVAPRTPVSIARNIVTQLFLE